MKHAYLILAHGQWELLQALISTIDDERNDIFVHIDAKAGAMPVLNVAKAGLFVLKNRVDVRWGDVSVVDAEHALFSEALGKGPYGYYHLLSGTDLPLRTQDEIHSFFEANAGQEFVGYTLTEMNPELMRKVCRWHLFPRHFRRRSILRAAFLRIQELVGWKRNSGMDFKKGSQWVSLTDAGARLFVEGYPAMRKVFSHTFCADEIAVQTLIWNSPLRAHIHSLDSDSEGCARAIGWKDGCLYDWGEGDYDALSRSDAMFARKFNLSDRAFLRRIAALSIRTPHSVVTPQVSVIMPVYNAAATLERSLSSLKEQTLKDFEAVFVDDCSTDGSDRILEDFARTSGISCKLLHQERNSGVAAARNRGLEAAEGEFVAWLDADDSLSPDALQKAVDAATPIVPGQKADIVGFDWMLGFEKNSRHMRQADWNSPLEALKALCGGTARWNLWLFLLRREFILEEGLRFDGGADMGEDMAFMIRAFSSAVRVRQIHEPLYRYNASSSTSISRSFDASRRAEIEANLSIAARAIASSPYAVELGPCIDHLKLYLKLPLLMSADLQDYRLWYSWMAEANGSALKNNALPPRTRMLQWMASKKIWAGVWLYHVFVYKFVYGLIYR